MDAMIRSRLTDGLNYYKNDNLTLEEVLNGFEEVLKDYSPAKPEVKPANGGHSKEIITYVLTEPFHDDWYDVAEFDTLEEAKVEYEKKNVAAIIEKRLHISIIFKKG